MHQPGGKERKKESASRRCCNWRLSSRQNPHTGKCALHRSAGFPACGFTGLSSPASQNPAHVAVPACARRRMNPRNALENGLLVR
jgi:hypothetical protein